MTREMFHGSAVLRALVEKVHQDHVDRLDGPEAEKLVPRPYRGKRRANTAIIAQAAQRSIARRLLREKDEAESNALLRSWGTGEPQ